MVAFLAGAINSIAGGGSFLTFPALVLAGVPPIGANATNNAAMFVGTFGSIRGYREELKTYRRLLPPGVIASLLGGTVGAILLLRTPAIVFERMIPWLLLFAIVVFTISPFLTRKVEAHDGGRLHAPWQLAMQFVVAIYGGYFGAGIGYLMLAILSFTGLPNMNVMNGIKNLMGSCINGVALIPFIIAGIVDWKYAILMSIFAIFGGYAGARVVRRIPSHLTRGAVIVLGFGMTAYFFLKPQH